MYCNVCNEYRKLKKYISYSFKETFSLYIAFTVSMVMNMKKYLKKKNQLKYKKIIGLINDKEEYQKNIITIEENISQHFTKKKIDESN